jgi:hypothetical protein
MRDEEAEELILPRRQLELPACPEEDPRQRIVLQLKRRRNDVYTSAGVCWSAKAAFRLNRWARRQANPNDGACVPLLLYLYCFTCPKPAEVDRHPCLTVPDPSVCRFQSPTSLLGAPSRWPTGLGYPSCKTPPKSFPTAGLPSLNWWQQEDRSVQGCTHFRDECDTSVTSHKTQALEKWEPCGVPSGRARPT